MSEHYKVSNTKIGFLSLFSATSILILVNILAFLLFWILISLGFLSIDLIAIKASDIFNGKHLWTFLTSMFMHSGFAHIFFNMISLFFVGTFIEKIIGRKRYIWFYLISGLFAALFFVSLSYFFGNSVLGEKIFGNPNISGVGASGALFGLVGLLAVLIPGKKVYLILGPLIAIILQSILVNIPSLQPIRGVIDLLLTIYIFISIFSMFSFNGRTRRISLPVEMPFWLLPIVAIIPLIIIGLFVNLPIGNTAHLGGLIIGLIYGIYLKNKYKKKVSYLRSHFR